MPVNSTADEDDPAISPDGRSLYFASNRDRAATLDLENDAPDDAWSGTLRHRESSTFDIYSGIRNGANEPWGSVVSLDTINRAGEIRNETEWDMSNLNAISVIAAQALLLTLLILVMAALFFAARGRFLKAAASMQFFAGSVVIHLLLLFLLAIWNLPRVIEVITSKKFDAEASTQLFDDNQHQSHEDGRAAYEKLADLQSLENTTEPDVMRQETEAFNVPVRTDNPLHSIPMEIARRLPPERLLFIPPNREAPKRPVPQASALPALSRPAPSIAESAVEPETTAVDLSKPAEIPGERSIATQIDMPRSEQLIQPVQFDIRVANAPKLRMESTTNLTPPAVEISSERKATTLPMNPLEMRVAPVPNHSEFVTLAPRH